MKFKQFIKPTKEKIIVAIVLFILLPVPWKILIIGGPNECEGLKTCILGAKHQWLMFGGYFLISSIFSEAGQPFETAIDYLWKVPYLIIVSYLLAYCIVYLFKRIRK